MIIDRKSIGLAALLPLLAVTQVQAQGFLGGLMGGDKKPDAAATAKDKKVDPDAILLRGTGILVCLALANERALAAQEKMLAAFPDDRIAGIKQKFEKYNEAKVIRKADTSPDATKLGVENQAAVDCQAEMAKLMDEKVEFKKGYGAEASAAYTQVGWAVGIDLLAAVQVPGFIKEAQALVQSLGSNPFQLNKIKGATALVVTMGASLKTLPSQIDALKSVQTVSKKIALAEKVALKEATPAVDLDPKQVAGTGGTIES